MRKTAKQLADEILQKCAGMERLVGLAMRDVVPAVTNKVRKDIAKGVVSRLDDPLHKKDSDNAIQVQKTVA